MDRPAFYAALRRRDSGLFGTSLSQAQVDGLEAILNECQRGGCDLGQAAYILATAYGETGGKMQPVRENMNYRAAQIAKHFGKHRRQGLEPHQLARKPKLLANTVYGGQWGRQNLGNVKPDDGWNFRGFGVGQWTGRTNTEKAGRDIGIDLTDRPELLDDVGVNARLLVAWMMAGRATGKALPSFVKGTRRNYLGARAVWGGVDPEKYARHAAAFEAALKQGGWQIVPPHRPDVEPTVPATSWLANLLRLIFSRWIA